MNDISTATPAATYGQLLHAGTAGALDPTTPRAIHLGDGNATPLALTTSQLFISGSAAITLVTADLRYAALSPVPYTVSSPVSGSVTLDLTHGNLQEITVNGNITAFNAPANGTKGSTIEVWATCSGGPWNFTPDAAIGIPSDRGLTWPKALASGGFYILKFKHNGTKWVFVTLLGAY